MTLTDCCPASPAIGDGNEKRKRRAAQDTSHQLTKHESREESEHPLDELQRQRQPLKRRDGELTTHLLASWLLVLLVASGRHRGWTNAVY